MNEDKRIGNQFWKARSSHGRKPKFATSEVLKEACYEYFEWCENNPLQQYKIYMYQGNVILAEIPKMRAMTIRGLCIFLDIEYQTWRNYANGEKKGFFEVIEHVQNIVYDQKFSGAAAGLLNANIIARDLGLKDSAETEIMTLPNYEALPEPQTAEEAAKAYFELLKDI